MLFGKPSVTDPQDGNICGLHINTHSILSYTATHIKKTNSCCVFNLVQVLNNPLSLDESKCLSLHLLPQTP